MSRLTDYLSRRPVALTGELREAGIHPDTIRAALDAGVAVRPWHGLIATPEAADHPRFEDAAIALSTGGVIARRTAAMRQGLSTDLPGATEVLIPAGTRRTAGDLPLLLLRSRLPESMTVGVETEEVLGVPFRMTGRARTVVDHWRGWPVAARAVPPQHVQEVLQTYLQEGGDHTELIEVGRAFGPVVTDRLTLAVDTFLNHPTRSF
ncbi:type IV toxin-antitoxin system AbiEi family antitoxin domain-containing protein [Methylobacterium sp. 391_Methyba4]|uniref:type IV toxin-antitoxin system AbiEi family antitoxin domain-containing protein n=1 Tax=Methylobacterium sp. 391_Methyba4 TaxID=3038924 RepID=UPI00241D64E4|nr:hypothetical protein [Methylobacterium sp. 391_Methyba4]WFS10462.1 hypothetical protein P9K36_14780 [Methylobacterium sp. 391_Methyba4]